MLNMLKGYNGSVEINGKKYDSVESARIDFETFSGSVRIKLHPKQLETKSDASNAIRDVNTIRDVNKPTEYRVTVKKYMTEQSSPGFDFMLRWNNDVPMPLRTMTGIVLQETKGMIKMRLHGMGKPEIHCMRCGRELTNPVSRHYGIGPECMCKIGFVGIAIDDIDLIREKLQNVTWEGWIIKSAITEQEEVTE